MHAKAVPTLYSGYVRHVCSNFDDNTIETMKETLLLKYMFRDIDNYTIAEILNLIHLL